MDYNVTFRQKDKSIQCIISYKDENDKWRQKSKQGFKTQKESKPWVKATVEELEEQIKLNKKTDPTLKDITFKDLMEKYISHKKLHREENSIRVIQNAHKKFEHLDDMKVADISKADTQYCVDLMVTEGYTNSSIKTYISVIKTAFNYAISDIEIINNNPLNKITMPADKEDGNENVKALTKNELNDIFKKMTNITYKLMSMLAATCGLRIGEIIGLTWDNVDFAGATLKINKQWKRLDNGSFGIGKVKRKNSNRTVPIPAETLQLLKYYKSLMPIHTSKRIFYTISDISGISKNLKRVYRFVGYEISIHDLRHTYATHLIANGLDFKTAAKLLGHDVQETLKVYSHVTDDMMKKATNVIEKIF